LRQSFALLWRIAAIGAESTGKAVITRGPADARLQVDVKVERLDLARLFKALGIEPPAGAETLGSVSVVIGVAGPFAEPASLVITQRIDFTPPAQVPPALARLRQDFAHEVTAVDGTRQTIDVSPASPSFIARADVPPLLVQTLLIGEDAAFFSHHGLDLGELPKALATNWAQGSAIRGASTITQQLAKNLWLSPSRNPLRKVQEAILTWQLERSLSKRRILELYLNVVEFGPGVYGVEAASRRYFSRPAAAITSDEAPELAASLPSPTRWHPGSTRPGYRRHVESIRRRMEKATFLTSLL
jgi:monofunctional biosynthetic peptidoglycan transglycosylase